MIAKSFPIPSFPCYRAIETGDVMNADGVLLRARVNKRTGYLQINLSVDGKRYTRNVHALVCEAFNGTRPVGCEACHYDGVRLNNAAQNVYWGTKKRNGQDRVKHGTSGAGESNCSAVLNVQQVRLIAHIAMLPAGLRPSAAKIAELFNVSDQCVLNIINGRNWKDATRGIITAPRLRKSRLTETEVADILRNPVSASVKKYRFTAEWLRAIKRGAAKFSRGTNYLLLAGVI